MVASTSILVLKRKRNLIYADPKLVTDSKDAAKKVVSILGGDEQDIAKKFSESRYVILAKKTPTDQAQRLCRFKKKQKGFTEDVTVRTNP